MAIYFILLQAENIRSADNKKSEKLEEPQNPAFFIIPQPESLVYAVQAAPLVSLPQAKYVTAANLQALPLGVQASVVSPYTSQYIQFYQWDVYLALKYWNIDRNNCS